MSLWFACDAACDVTLMPPPRQSHCQPSQAGMAPETPLLTITMQPHAPLFGLLAPLAKTQCKVQMIRRTTAEPVAQVAATPAVRHPQIRTLSLPVLIAASVVAASLFGSSARAQTSKATTSQATPQPTASPVNIPLDAQQAAALGIRYTPLQAAHTGMLLASATVGVPPGREVTVAAPYAGVIHRVLVGLGDKVAAGATLAQWSSPMLADARRQLRDAQIELDNAQSAAQRDKAMLDEGVIPAARAQLSANRLKSAQATVQAREAELRSAGVGTGLASGKRSDGGYDAAPLASPMAGVVVDSFASVGQRVDAGTVLFRVADLRDLQLDIVLSPDKAAQLRAGDAVSVPTRGAKAVVIGIGRSVDASQQARARARVTQPGSLQAGEALQVQLHPGLAETAGSGNANAWQIPARAIISHQGGSWVFVQGFVQAGANKAGAAPKDHGKDPAKDPAKGPSNPQGLTAIPIQVVSSNDDLAVITSAARTPLSGQHHVAITGLTALRALLSKEP